MSLVHHLLARPCQRCGLRHRKALDICIPRYASAFVADISEETWNRLPLRFAEQLLALDDHLVGRFDIDELLLRIDDRAIRRMPS